MTIIQATQTKTKAHFLPEILMLKAIAVVTTWNETNMELGEVRTFKLGQFRFLTCKHKGGYSHETMRPVEKWSAFRLLVWSHIASEDLNNDHHLKWID